MNRIMTLLVMFVLFVLNFTVSHPTEINAQQTPIIENQTFSRFYAIDIHWDENNNQTIALVGSQSLDVFILDQNQNVISTFDPFSDPTIPGGVGIILELHWNPNGTHIAVPLIETFDGSILQIWDISAGTFESFPFEPIAEVAWSPRGDLIAIRTESSVILWDFATRQTLYVLDLPGRPIIRDISWESDGSHIAIVNDDGLLWVWNVDTEAVVMELNPGNIGLSATEIETLGNPVYWNIEWEPDGHRLAVNDITNSTIEIWDVEQQILLGILAISNRYALMRWGNGGFAIINGDSIQQIDIQTGSILREIERGEDELFTLVEWHPTRPEIIYAISSPNATFNEIIRTVDTAQ